MFDCLISGRLIRDPQTRTGPSGKPFTTALLSVAAGEEKQVVNVIAFGSVGEKLAKLKQGDSISVTGPAKLGIYEKNGETRPSPSITATAILSAYDARKRRGESDTARTSRRRSRTAKDGKRTRPKRSLTTT